jgi:hypothetical protein
MVYALLNAKTFSGYLLIIIALSKLMQPIKAIYRVSRLIICTSGYVRYADHATTRLMIDIAQVLTIPSCSIEFVISQLAHSILNVAKGETAVETLQINVLFYHLILSRVQRFWYCKKFTLHKRTENN